jgi:hypothetical protein
MNAKATRTLFAAVALSALAAVLASSAHARIPEGNGTQPPFKTVVSEQQAPQGNGTFSVDPEIYAAMTLPTVVEQRLARNVRRAIDADICAALDSAIRAAIQECSHAVPGAAKQLRTGTGQARLEKFPDGYRGRP